MRKYNIKNCPAIAKNKNFPSEYNCLHTMIYTCKNKTDCILKQVVEYCLAQNLKYDTTACDILDIIDIQEVE